MFKQIIPATGWWLRREVEGGFIDEPVVAWGLYEEPEHNGDPAVTGLIVDPDGGLGLCEASCGFYVHQSEVDRENPQDQSVPYDGPLGLRGGAKRKV